MALPDHLLDAPDGLYGDLEAFLSPANLQTMNARYAALEADNAIDETKIRRWIWSESFAVRQAGGEAGVPGCTLEGDN